MALQISHRTLLMVEAPLPRDEAAPPGRPAARAEILGPRFRLVSAGSTVALQCRVPDLPAPPVSLYWTRDGRGFSARDRTGISIESEKIAGTSTSKAKVNNIDDQALQV